LAEEKRKVEAEESAKSLAKIFKRPKKEEGSEESR